MAEAAPSSFATAARHNARDMIGAFVPRFPEAALPLVRGPAQNITRLVFHYERLVGETDLVQASHWLLPHFTRSVQPVGLTAIPPGTPLLVVSNHPGVMDAMALFAWLARPDLKVITAERPILTLLPNIAQHLILLPDADAGERRIRVLRAALAHLRAGGALLHFPAGEIEPDPAYYASALQSLADWSASIALFARQVPELTILPVAVSGVISLRALRSPLAQLYREGRRRSWVAATLQVMFTRWRDCEVMLRFGAPLAAGPSVAAQVQESMDALLRASLREGEAGREGEW